MSTIEQMPSNLGPWRKCDNYRCVLTEKACKARQKERMKLKLVSGGKPVLKYEKCCAEKCVYARRKT